MKANELNVYGKNEIKRVALAEVKNLLPQLMQYLGKRIDTQAGLSKKFILNYAKPKPLPIGSGFASLQNCYVSVKYETLVLNITLCFNGGKYADNTYYCQYFERSIELGKVENFILTEVFKLENIISFYGLDYVIDLEEETKKIEQYKALMAEASKIKSTIKIEF